MGTGMWKSTDERTYMNSFPRCGRHWVMIILVKYFRELYNIPDDKKNIMELWKFKLDCPDIPFLAVDHDDLPCYKESHQLAHSRKKSKNLNIIFLIRDPRDVMVSNYFWTFKSKLPKENLIDKLRDWVINNKMGGLETLIEYYNIWAENINVPKKFMLLKYEDLAVEAENEIYRVLKFMNAEINNEYIKKAVEFGRFENVHKLEKMRIYEHLKHRDLNDPETYVTRKGKVGGYVDYLSKKEIDIMNDIINKNLNDYYSFYK